MNPDDPIPPPPLRYRMMQAVMWPMMKVLGVTCESAFHLCSRHMDRELTAGEETRLRFHLMMCGICRSLPRQFHRIRHLVRCAEQAEPDPPADVALSEQAKHRIADHLKKQAGEPS